MNKNTSWSDAAKQSADSVLPRIRAAKTLSDIKSAGCTIEAVGEALKVTGTLPEAIRILIREQKADLLAYLKGKPVTTEPWNQEEGDKLIADGVALLSFLGYHKYPDTASQQIKVTIQADRCWISKDIGGLKAALGEFRKLCEVPYVKPTTQAIPA